jgi:hypothetical protein
MIKIFNQEESESGRQESRKGISEIEDKAARVMTEFQASKLGRKKTATFAIRGSAVSFS